MGLFYRVFGASAVAPDPRAILEHLNALGATVSGKFSTDAAGWFAAELFFADTTPLHLERFLATEEGIRAELNSWAGFLETCDYSPNHQPLMERMIQTAQLFTLRRPIDVANEALVERLCVGLSLFLAERTDGVWQADGEGFFSANGAELLREY